MDKISITLKLPTGMLAWLEAQGDPDYRSAKEQAAYLCSQYLIGAFKRAQAAGDEAEAARLQRRITLASQA